MNQHLIAHCNLTEENIFVSPEGRILISDFSSSISCSSTICARSTIDSVHELRRKNVEKYAPEVVEFINLDDDYITQENVEQLWNILKQNDVYQIGIILFSLLGVKISNMYEHVPDLNSQFYSHGILSIYFILNTNNIYLYIYYISM